MEFVYNNSYQASIGMAPYEALYGRPCRSPLCWVETGEPRVLEPLLGPDYVRDTSEKVAVIRQRLLTAQSRQKKYADHRHTALQFPVGGYVFLRVDARKGLRTTRKLGKLAPRYIGPFKILKRIGPVAYRLELPPQLAGIIIE